MKYYSTKNKNLRVSLKEAVFKGLAADGGLYMPEELPRPRLSFFTGEKSFPEVAYEVAKAFFGDDIPAGDLKDLTFDAINFDTPLVQVEEDVFALELFHGPTLAFKDVGARYMARLLQYLTKDHKQEIHVLVATSGDTGSAVANGFLGVEGIRVHILYPRGLVSLLQEKQFTTLGKNITALEIDGSFDDCQRLVKQAFTDKELNRELTLTSANSINVARLLPQSFYYYNAYCKLKDKNRKIVFSVPSGNFGNLTSGVIAAKTGLPVSKFIAATNINDVVPEYLTSGIYTPRPSVSTIANAMDVGDPSNFARILDLYGNSHGSISEDIKGYSYPDSRIREAIRLVSGKDSYLLDPHGATAYLALKEFMRSNHGLTGIFLETAHPAKFLETVEECTGEKVEIPQKLAGFLKKEKKTLPLGKSFEIFKDYLLGIK